MCNDMFVDWFTVPGQKLSDARRLAAGSLSGFTLIGEEEQRKKNKKKNQTKTKNKIKAGLGMGGIGPTLSVVQPCVDACELKEYDRLIVLIIF